MTTYIALMRKDPDSDYSVDFPDFPGCVTAGLSLDEAKDMAGEALALHIAGMKEDGEALPSPSTLETVMAAPDNRDAVAFLVEAAAKLEKVKRYSLTFRPSVMAVIDAEATAAGTTRSAFLAEAALKVIREGDGG